LSLLSNLEDPGAHCRKVRTREPGSGPGVHKLRHEPHVDTNAPSYLLPRNLAHLYHEPALDTEETIRDFITTTPPPN